MNSDPVVQANVNDLSVCLPMCWARDGLSWFFV